MSLAATSHSTKNCREPGSRKTKRDGSAGPARWRKLAAAVVLDADAGEEGDLLAPEARHASQPSVARQAGPLRCEAGTPRCEELADVVCVAHHPTVRAGGSALGGTASTPNSHVFLHA